MKTRKDCKNETKALILFGYAQQPWSSCSLHPIEPESIPRQLEAIVPRRLSLQFKDGQTISLQVKHGQVQSLILHFIVYSFRGNVSSAFKYNHSYQAKFKM